jgi:polysaccharide biosynthesis transport protein
MDSTKVSPPQEAKLHFLDYWRIIRIRKTVILAVFLLVVITATLVTFILPEAYSSTARIEVQRDQSDIQGINGSMYSMTYDPYFIQTEFEVIKSEKVLVPVIDRLDLRRQWGKKMGAGELKTEEAMSMLRSRLDLRPVRNTIHIDIGVYSDDKNEAAQIANAIAAVYADYRLQKSMRLVNGGIEALEARFKEQENKVKEKQKEVDRLREELKIPDSMAANSDATAPLITGDTLRQIESLRIQGMAEYQKEKSMLEALQQLDPSRLAETIPNVGVSDTLLSALQEELNQAEQNKIKLSADLGPMHSEVVKVTELINDLTNKISKRVEGYMNSLDNRVKSLGAHMTTLSNEVTKAMQNDIDKTISSRPYWVAKHELEEQLRWATMLNAKIFAEQTDLKLPKTGMVSLIDTAKPGMRPVRPNKTLNIVLGIIIGLVVGVGLAFFIEYLDTSVKTIDDVERSLQAPVLGVIPQNVGLILEEGAESPHAEAYRVLRTNLLFSRKDDKLNTVAVISAGAGEGKSTTVFNLAAVFAQSGQRVLIVDSDLRRPTLHKMLRVTNNLGLTNYLLKQNTLEEVVQTTNLPTLDFLASGKLPSSSLGILSSAQMRDFITELKQHYDFVFFDSPPVMGVSDASILASEVDMTLQVIQYRRYPQPMNIRAKQLIEKVGGNLVGIVLNNINMSQDESYYYYSGYYHDYYSRNEDQEPTPPAEPGPAKPS